MQILLTEGIGVSLINSIPNLNINSKEAYNPKIKNGHLLQKSYFDLQPGTTVKKK